MWYNIKRKIGQNINQLYTLYHKVSCVERFSNIFIGGKPVDKKLTCKDCGKEFIWTEGEQDFYKQKGFTNEPARCPECRRAKKSKFNNDRF